MPVSKMELAEFKTVAEGFSKDLLKLKSNGVKEFTSKLSPLEILKIGYYKLRSEFASSANPDEQARLFARYCNATIPGLQRVYTSDEISRALQAQNPTQRTADIARAHNANRLADLVEKSMAYPNVSA